MTAATAGVGLGVGVGAADLQGTCEGRDRRLEFAEPVPGLPQAGQDPGLPQPPLPFWARQGQRPFVQVRRRSGLRGLQGLITRPGQGLDRLGHGEIGLSGAGRADADDDVVIADGLEIVALALSLGHDSAAQSGKDDLAV